MILRRVVFGLGAAISLVGCRTSEGVMAEQDKKRRELYDYVYTVDSHIPQKVPKGWKPHANNGAAPVAVIDGEKAREVVRIIRPGH